MHPPRRNVVIAALAALGTVLVAPAGATAAPPGTPAPGTPGALDGSFGNAASPVAAGLVLGGSETSYAAVVVQPDGKVLAAGYEGSPMAGRLIVARYTVAGQLDPTFGTAGIARGPATFAGPEAGSTGSYAGGVAVQTDGRVVVAGGLVRSGGPNGLVAMRFTPAGTLDPTFSVDGVASALVGPSRAALGRAVLIDAQNRVIVAGAATEGNTETQWGTVAAFRADGVLDGGFGSGGVVQRVGLGTYGEITALAAAPGGDIVTAGQVSGTFGDPQAIAYRLNADGSPDAGFAGGQFIRQFARNAAISRFTSVAVSATGEVVAAGTAGNLSGADAFAVRFDGAGQPISSFGSAGVYQEPVTDQFATSAGRNPLPGAAAILARPSTVYLAGPVEASGGYRLLFLTALSRANGTRVSGFGAPVGAQYSSGLSFAAPFGTTYTFIHGASDSPYSGPMGQTLALASTPDGTGLVAAGVVAGSLSGRNPTGNVRGFVARYQGLVEPAVPAPTPGPTPAPTPAPTPGPTPGPGPGPTPSPTPGATPTPGPSAPGGTTPPPPASLLAPTKLSVLGSGIEEGRIRIRIRATSLARGTSLALRYRSAGVTTPYTVRLPDTTSNKEIAATYRLRLPAAQRRGTTGIIDIASPTTTAVRADSVRLRIARNPAGLVRKRTEITADGSLVVSGRVTDRAVGIVRLRMEYADASRQLRSLDFRARITDGEWALSERLPEEARIAGGQLSIQYTGHLPTRTRGEQTAKQVRP